MPASRIAVCTAVIVSSICTLRPISSGRKLRVWAIPMLRRLLSPALAWARGASSTSLREKTVRCGESTPSVPPDMTKAILSSTSDGGSLRCGDSAWHSAATAYSRVKSLTPPFPSVLPSTARIDAGATLPASMNLISPETSPGPLVGMRQTSTAIMLTLPCRSTARSLAASSRRWRQAAAIPAGAIEIISN